MQREILAIQMLLLGLGRGWIRWGDKQRHRPRLDPVLHWVTFASPLIKYSRLDHWDNYAINIGSEKKVGHATFRRLWHSHILTGLGMKSNTWHRHPSNPKALSCRVKLLSYFNREERARVTSSHSNWRRVIICGEKNWHGFSLRAGYHDSQERKDAELPRDSMFFQHPRVLSFLRNAPFPSVQWTRPNHTDASECTLKMWKAYTKDISAILGPMCTGHLAIVQLLILSTAVRIATSLGWVRGRQLQHGGQRASG